MDIKSRYVIIHKQGWIPIFIEDGLDAVMLAEICVENGLKTIEITCRRSGVVKDIKAVKAAFPELIILAGSTVDSDSIVGFLRKQKPDMPTLEELADIGVDGFVGLLPFMRDTIEKYRKDLILIPGQETIMEAYRSIQYGAHFVKFCSVSPERIKLINGDATHKIFPLFATGGISHDRIADYLKAGAVSLGTGWDLILKGLDLKHEPSSDRSSIAQRLRLYTDAAFAAQKSFIPDFVRKREMDDDGYINALTHYHPFVNDDV